MVAHLIAALIGITTCDAAPKFAELNFVHIPKNGGTRVAGLLRRAGVKMMAQPRSPDVACSARHTPPRHVKATAATSFAILRHPYERALSEWSWGRKGVWTPQLGYEASGDGMNAFIRDALRNASSPGRPPTREHLRARLYQATRGGPFHGDCHWLPQAYYVFDDAGRRTVDATFCLGNQALAVELSRYVGVALGEASERPLEGMISNGTRTRTTVRELIERRKCNGKCTLYRLLSDDVLAALNDFYAVDFETFGFSRATTAGDIAVDVRSVHPEGAKWPSERHTIRHSDAGVAEWCFGESAAVEEMAPAVEPD